MKHLIICLTAVLFFKSENLFSQTYEKSILDWQQELNASFIDEAQTPLSKKALKKFKGLDFFSVDSAYLIKALLVRTPNELPFNMPTTTERSPVYVKFGMVIFDFKGKAFNLPVYKSLTLLDTDAMKDYLFLPFTDETNGVESYGGGRYLDLTVPKGDTILLDFNKAYNPYCAYNENYSCPIPPKENHISIEIRAGVMNWE